MAASDLKVIQTEAIGFRSIAGESKVRLTSPWPFPPQTTVSLLSIASRRGLVAAAAPDCVVLATTESVRKAFESSKVGDTEVRPFQPQLKITLPTLVSHLAFSHDENFLLLTAQSGGGLAVYKVDNLLQGLTHTEFELSTNGEQLRAISPNPTAERAELCAVVTAKGALHVANLNERQFSGNLQSNVVCTSWSNKGKQLVAGHADGTISQMTPEGEVKAVIPRPPQADGFHVSSVLWLENNLFLSIHSSTISPQLALYHIITRQPSASFSFQRLVDPVQPFGSEKTPQHYILRLKDFAPNLQDLLIVSSTASSDIGLLTRSKAPLAPDNPASSITDVFTTTELADDTKRATLPMTESMDDSIPLGTALDLSGKETVYKPIPTDEMDESKGPLPGLWLLTHEGILCCWWIVYVDSVKQGLTYQGLVMASATESMASSTTQLTNTNTLSSTQSFGRPTIAAPSFGSAATIGSRVSPWGAAASSGRTTGGPVFGSSTFGQMPSSVAPSLGSSQVFGQPASAGSKSPAATTMPTFGQSGFGSQGSTASIFGAPRTAVSEAATSGGFATFAGQSGFSSLAGIGKPSIFGDKSKNTSLLEASMQMDTAFPVNNQAAQNGGLFASKPLFQEGTKPNSLLTGQDDKMQGSLASDVKSSFSIGEIKADPDVVLPTREESSSRIETDINPLMSTLGLDTNAIPSQTIPSQNNSPQTILSQPISSTTMPSESTSSPTIPSKMIRSPIIQSQNRTSRGITLEHIPLQTSTSETIPYQTTASRKLPSQTIPTESIVSPSTPSPITPSQVETSYQDRDCMAGTPEWNSRSSNAFSKGQPQKVQHGSNDGLYASITTLSREEAESKPLIDELDDEIQRTLASDVEASLVLDEFIAHVDVVPPAKETIPSQVETVYRDINSMVDTLGLNSRSLMAFIKGQSQKIYQGGRSVEDLEALDEWVLCEIPELGNIIDEELDVELSENRVQDWESKLEACHEISRDMSRLRAKQGDLKKVILAKADPEHASVFKSLALSPEQMAQQIDLRREYARISQLLSQAEEALALLKARIVSSSVSSGRVGAHVPTVDAVLRTINKMTSMAEKRSGDVDVLESQMRKLRVGSATNHEDSPRATPQKKAIAAAPSSLGISSSDFSTPLARINLRASFASSAGSAGARASTPLRRKLSSFSTEEKSALVEKLEKRRAVLRKLEDHVMKQGIQVWGMEEIE